MNSSLPVTPTPEAGPAQPEPALTLTLLLVDQCQRWQRGERILVEDYLRDRPALAADRSAVLDLVYNEFRLREEQGEAPQVSEYLNRFQYLAPELQLQLDVHRALASEA